MPAPSLKGNRNKPLIPVPVVREHLTVARWVWLSSKLRRAVACRAFSASVDLATNLFTKSDDSRLLLYGHDVLSWAVVGLGVGSEGIATPACNEGVLICLRSYPPRNLHQRSFAPSVLSAKSR